MKEGRMKSQNFAVRVDARNLRVAQIPLEWYGNHGWRLPSGKPLAEFALQAGFLAPLLFKMDRFAQSDSLLAQSAEPAGKSKQFKKVGHS